MDTKKVIISLVLLAFLSNTAAEAFPFFGANTNNRWGGGYPGYYHHHHHHRRHCRW